MSARRLRSSETLSNIISSYYKEGEEAHSQNKPVAWVTSVAPVEILTAMDIFPLLPENYAATCAAKHMSAEFCEAAEARGYSIDLCSYAKTFLGSAFTGKGPYRIPKADVIINTAAACDTHVKWFQDMGRVFDCPVLMVDTAFALDEEQKPYLIEYFVSELKNLVADLEKCTGRKMDIDRLREAVTLSSQAAELWGETVGLRKAIPCPLGPIDIVTCMFPTVTLSGTKIAVDFYQQLYSEVKELVDNKVGVIPDEKYRLCWDIFPLFYNLRLFNYFQERGAVIVVDLYGESFSATMSASDPFLALAEKYLLKSQVTWGHKTYVETFKRLIKDYHVDGAIWHANRSCRFHSPRQQAVKRALQAELDIPSLIFEADMTDPRQYADARVKASIDSFLEMLEARKSTVPQAKR